MSVMDNLHKPHVLFLGSFLSGGDTIPNTVSNSSSPMAEFELLPHHPKPLLLDQNKYQEFQTQFVLKDAIVMGKPGFPTVSSYEFRVGLGSQKASQLGLRDKSTGSMVRVQGIVLAQRSNKKVAKQGNALNQASQNQETEGQGSESRDDVQEVESRVRKEQDGSKSSEENEPSIKCSRRQLDTIKFPWHKKQVNTIASLVLDIKQTFDQLERFSVDPKGVRVPIHLSVLLWCGSQLLNQALMEEGSQIRLVQEERDENLATSGIRAHVLSPLPNVTLCIAVTEGDIAEPTRSLISHISGKQEKDPNRVIVESPRY
ncbi:uncharacterized protein EDB91DRAFT_1088518 [Suillus paluster]|uniref:uncharacterized protein n=1 Tax=Suillus paluster TaxID=48578 RepID=UPI001B864572|nr:uncharacterized protein EDB91DRAFT_1088518 [Suillus paluster]KAG1721229.1 hypothetical protein EDB91DRAFT_1088518 [Suillus paluster]